MQGRHTRLDLDWVSLSTSYSCRPTLDGSNALRHSCFKAKAAAEEFGLKQGPLLRPPMPLECKWSSSRDPNIGEEGKNTPPGRRRDTRGSTSG